MNQRTRFLGLDVHKATIAVAVCEATGAAQAYGTIPNQPAAVRKLAQRLGGVGVRLNAAYEAGPTGFVTQRQLTALGVECVVVAPSLMPRRPGDRVKTDRRDALQLARLLRSGALTPVWIPDEAHEALRNLVRARADARIDLMRARNRLGKYLLRQGLTPPPGIRAWSLKHVAWLRHLNFRYPADQVVFQDYWQVVTAAGDRLRRLELELHRVAEQSPQLPLIAALQAIRGIAFLTAVTIVAEVGDLRRFQQARQFMAYTGLVPSEHSSGGSTYRGRITRTGNALLRHVLGEAAHHARHQPRLSALLRQRQAGVPPALTEIAWQSQQRLNYRYRHLAARLGRPRALTAVARELAGFVWAIGQETPIIPN